MRRSLLRRLLAILLLLASTLALAGPARVPSVTGEDLTGQAVSLPGGLRGELNLLIVAFLREHHEQALTWTGVARELEKRSPGFAWYELPVFEELPGMLQGLITRAMKEDIDAASQRSTLLLWLEDKAAFQRALSIEGDELLHPMLVNRQGEVLWRTTGPMTPEGAAALRGAVEGR